MKKDEAKQIIKNIFEHEFNDDNFLLFAKNLFKKFEISNFEPDVKNSFKSFISKYRIIGNFKDNAGNNIAILKVALSKDTSLERARTAQRNFIADYLGKNNKEAALVAFISLDNKDWRFSFVKLEHSLEVVDDKLKTKKEITSAKRWSFLVGEHEGSHTAQSRFVDLLVNDENPNLAEIELAFNIEIVTKEFFNKYTELFFKFKEQLDELLENDNVIKKDFEEKDISVVDFAKKTLGQIVFLYFLQKKGWFGVPADKKWGEGPKKFIRALFERRKKYGDNFFNDILEPLFYEALAQDRGKESIYPRLNNCRMPFLNGGLFEPMNDYKWETTNIIIPDELFSNNVKTKEGDIGTGILDVFDRYNFTVNENEPLEKEVAVDPEMLGKVFENLLDIKDRKSKGEFYTPREIVHYMCQESLINYLETETKNKIPREDLEFLIHKGDRIIENDKVSLEKTKGGKYPNEYYKIFTPEAVRTNAILLNELLKNIKVADPAVGSGAFPLGMINEIVRARKVLNIYLNENISDYELKKYTITHSIYGVDIEPGAVDIAKLRLWLALVVDEDTPHPLPNLEHKIMQGNSLISEYEGIKLFDDSILKDAQIINNEKDIINNKISLLQKEYFNLHANKQLTNTKKIEIEKAIKLLQQRLKDYINRSEHSEGSIDMFRVPEKRKIAQEKTIILQKKVEEYISESRRTQKQNLKEEIDNLKWDLIEISLEEQNKLTKLANIKKLRHKNIKPFFIWKLEFSDVFKEKGGFDIVIGNPPYVGESGNKDIFRPIAEGNLGKFYQGKMDLFYFFFHLALDLGKHNAKCAFITTNYFLTASGARKLRHDLKDRSNIQNLVNFNELKIFESALGQHDMITIFGKDNKLEKKAKSILTMRTGVANERILNDIVRGIDKKTIYTEVLQNELYDGDEAYIRILGTNNSDNPIQSILNKIQENNKLLGTFCNINQGVVSGCDYVSMKNSNKLENKTGIEKNDGIFVFDLTNKRDIEVLNTFTEGEKKLLRPFFKNSEISRYWCKDENSKLLLYYENKLDDIKFPNITSHLKRFYGILDGRLKTYGESYHWTALHRAREEKIFLTKKIVVPYRSTTNTFAINSQEWFCRSDCYIITEKTAECDLQYILALLNSSLYFQWLYHRGKRKGETLELFQAPLSEIPIMKISPEDQKPFINIVNQILAITSAIGYDPKNPPIKQKELEKKIDEMVYELYELTPEEIEIVENSSKE